MHSVDSYTWGDASVTYPDWSGTAQLDQRITGEGLHEIINLPKGWHVIGLDLGGGEHGHDLHVVAVRDELFDQFGDLPSIAQAHGGAVPAAEFLVHDVDPYEVLRRITHMFELRLRVRIIAEQRIPIEIHQLGDIPEQPA